MHAHTIAENVHLFKNEKEARTTHIRRVCLRRQTVLKKPNLRPENSRNMKSLFSMCDISANTYSFAFTIHGYMIISVSIHLRVADFGVRERARVRPLYVSCDYPKDICGCERATSCSVSAQLIKFIHFHFNFIK